jgi:hypothetical protein
MKHSINIFNPYPYQIINHLQNLMPHLSRCLIKTIGVDHDDKKNDKIKRIKEGKRPGKSMKTSVYHHLLRKIKRKLNTKKLSHENTKSA